MLPTAVTASLPDLATFAETVRERRPTAPEDGAEPLRVQPRRAVPRRGQARRPRLAHLIAPADMDAADLEPLLDGLRVVTVAPELEGRSV